MWPPCTPGTQSPRRAHGAAATGLRDSRAAQLAPQDGKEG